MSKGTKRIIIGIILIAFQFISLIGNLKYAAPGTLTTLIVPTSFYHFTTLLGFWSIGIIGLILLISGLIARSKNKT